VGVSRSLAGAPLRAGQQRPRQQCRLPELRRAGRARARRGDGLRPRVVPRQPRRLVRPGAPRHLLPSRDLRRLPAAHDHPAADGRRHGRAAHDHRSWVRSGPAHRGTDPVGLGARRRQAGSYSRGAPTHLPRRSAARLERGATVGRWTHWESARPGWTGRRAVSRRRWMGRISRRRRRRRSRRLRGKSPAAPSSAAAQSSSPDPAPRRSSAGAPPAPVARSPRRASPGPASPPGG